MAAKAKYDWEALLKEYLRSDCTSKTQFAESKGINASLLRRNTADWPSKSKSKSNSNKKPKRKVTAKSKSNKNEKVAPNQERKVTGSELALINDEGNLTEKQKLFCFFYVKSYNATQSAIKAGYTAKYPSEIGWQLLQIPKVRDEIQRLKNIKRRSIMISEDDIVERYMRIAFADMNDFADFGTEEYPAVDEHGHNMIDGNGSVKTRKRDYLEFKDSNDVDGGLICEISLGRSGMKVKLEDRQKALRWLADYFCMNPMNQHKIAYDKAVLSLRERELKTKEEGW